MPQHKTDPNEDLDDADVKRIREMFTFTEGDLSQIENRDAIARAAFDMGYTIIALTKPGRNRALAITRLEEAVMHAFKAVESRKHAVSQNRID